MDDRLADWLLDNRPYTHLSTRVKHFILYCKTQQPGLSTGALQRAILPLVDRFMLGEGGRLWMRDRCYERVLRLYGANDQRTDAWHAKRSELITASEVYQIFGSESARRDVMLRKLEPRVQGDGPGIPALLWGTRFEPVAKRLYEERTNCTIQDVSCVQHPRVSFLGASPDGLIVPTGDDPRRYGRLVEFKCPMSRKPSDEIPIGYWHQMQLQMECTGIDECEYVEFRFKQVGYTEWSRTTGTKGSFSVYEDGRVVYDETEVPEDAQVIYWILGSIKEDFVQKDPTWLSTHLPQLQAFWDEVLRHRAAGTKPDPTPKPGLPALDL
jgi:putative phage-type endonuclease